MPRAHVPDRLVPIRGCPPRAADDFDGHNFVLVLDALDHWMDADGRDDTLLDVLDRYFPTHEEAMGLDAIFGETTDDL